MDEHKDIGKTFKEGLNEFRKSPNAKVWDKIVAELDKKEEKKKPLIIWWKLVGIVAVLLLLFTIGYQTIMAIEKTNKKKIITKTNQLKKDSLKDNITITTINKNNLKNDLQKNRSIAPEKTLVKSTVKNYKIAKKTIKSKIDLKTKKQLVVIKNNKLDDKIALIKKEIKSVLDKGIQNNKLENNFIDKKIIVKQNKNNEKENLQIIAKTEKKNELVNKKNEELNILNEINKDTNKLDSKKEWQISIKAAPVFYSALDSGSSLDNNFTNNSKSSDVTLSYGVSISYPISKKIKIRTGFNKVDLSYKTEQILLGTASVAQTLTNTTINSLLEISGSSLDIINSKIDLTQEINYFEIPLEIKYAILDKKIGLEFITGISTLLLNNDSIILNDTTNTGSVNNLKEVSFTGNLSFGLHYKLSEKLNFNLEPNVKLQFNTYKDNVDYKPYFFGVYSGFSYQF